MVIRGHEVVGILPRQDDFARTTPHANAAGIQPVVPNAAVPVQLHLQFFSAAAELSGTLDAEAEADPGSWPDEYADEYDEKDGGGGLGFGAATMSEAAFEKKLWPAGIEPPKRIGSRTPGTLPRVAKKSGVYDPIVHG